jgi:hypothetical protein
VEEIEDIFGAENMTASGGQIGGTGSEKPQNIETAHHSFQLTCFVLGLSRSHMHCLLVYQEGEKSEQKFKHCGILVVVRPYKNHEILYQGWDRRKLTLV